MGRKKGVFGVKPPREKAEYKDTPEVQEVAAKLISKYHSHLAEARIKYMFRTGKWEQRGMRILGRACKVSAQWKFLTDYDFLIVINKDVWFANEMPKREAILDHELTHCARGEDDKLGNPKWYIQPHMVEDFPAIIARHGLWTNGLKNMFEANEKYEQMTIEEMKATGTEGK